MHRRDLLRGIPLVLLASCAARDDRPLVGGGGPYGGGGGGGGTSGATDFRVENHDDSGHQHWFEVTCTNLDDHILVYTALGPHTHTVTITDEDLDKILAGDQVRVNTTTPHPHTWWFELPTSAC